MDIQELVRAQRAYFLSGATRPYAFRMEQLKKLQRALQTNEKLLEQAMYQDFRKAPMEVYMCETGMVLEEVRFHLKHLKGWMRERTVPTPLAQFHAKSFVSPEPYGVALIISPWNYPVDLSAEIQRRFPRPCRSAARLRVAEQVEDRERLVKPVRREPRAGVPARDISVCTADAVVLTEQAQI